MTRDDIEAKKAECLSLLTAWAEETELSLRKKGVAFSPREREALDAAKARLALRIKKQPDEFWAEDMKARDAIGRLSEGLLPKIGGAL